LSGNEKVDKLKVIHNKLEVDIAAYCEHQLNIKHKKNCNGWEGRQQFNQLWLTMFMRTLEELNKGAQVSSSLGT
jgi:hypothetical protein